jgi:hypothetical protein
MFNWAKSIKLCEEKQVVKVASVKELQDLISKLPKDYKLKVKGTGMSYLGISALDNTEDSKSIFLDLSALAGLHEVTEDSATFGGNTTLQFVTDTLAAKNLQLSSCPGVLMYQTLAGNSVVRK